MTAAATRTRLRSTMITPLLVTSSQPLHERLKSLIAAQRVEVGIVLEPLAVSESILDRLLETGNGVVDLSHIRVGAGDVVQHAGILRIDRVRPPRPIEPLLPIAKLHQRPGTEVQRAGIIGVQLQV